MRSLCLVVALAVTVAACGDGAPSSDRPDPRVGRTAGATGVPTATGASATAARAAFLAIPLTDVRTGERFTLGGFTGKVTFAIAMAVW